VCSECCVQAKLEASKQAVGCKNRRRSNISFKSQKQRPFVEYTRGMEEEPRRPVPILPTPPCKISRNLLVTVTGLFDVDKKVTFHYYRLFSRDSNAIGSVHPSVCLHSSFKPSDL